MDARRYLEELSIQRKNLESKRTVLDIERESCLPVNYAEDKVQTQRRFDREENRIHHIMVKAEELALEEQRYQQRREEAEERIAKIKPDEAQAVLRLRYLGELPWDEIAEKLGYSKQRLYQLHTQGLMDLDIRFQSVEQIRAN